MKSFEMPELSELLRGQGPPNLVFFTAVLDVSGWPFFSWLFRSQGTKKSVGQNLPMFFCLSWYLIVSICCARIACSRRGVSKKSKQTSEPLVPATMKPEIPRVEHGCQALVSSTCAPEDTEARAPNPDPPSRKRTWQASNSPSTGLSSHKLGRKSLTARPPFEYRIRVPLFLYKREIS